MKNLSRNQAFWLILTAGSILAAAISLMIGLYQSVWFDEAYSVLLAKHSFGDIARLTSQDVHPPVYYWLLKVWMIIFGSGEAALRSLSAIFLGLSVGTAGLLIRRLFGRKVALVALPFIIFAPFLLRYGFEIRMYSLVSFFGILATYLLVMAVKAVEKSKRRWLLAVYGLIVTLSMYTLYFMALIWVMHLVWLAWFTYKNKKIPILIEAVATYFVSFLLFLPWLPVLLGKTSGSTLSPVTGSLGFDNLLGIISFTFLYHPPWQLGVFYPLMIAAVIVSVVILAIHGFRQISRREQPFMILAAAYVAVPIVILMAVTHFLPIYLERYIAHIIIGGYLFVGVAVALALKSKKLWTLVPCGVLVLVLMIGFINLIQYGNYNFQRVHKPSVKQLSQLLGDCKNGATIYADDAQITMELRYYITDCPIYFSSSSKEMTGGFLLLSNSPLWVADPSRQFKDDAKLFYVYYNQPTHQLPDSMGQVSVKTIEKLSVATYERK